MKKFNFLENLLRKKFAMSGMSGMSGMRGLRVDAVNPDSQPTVSRQSRLTSVQRHDSVTSARVAREWLNGSTHLRVWPLKIVAVLAILLTIGVGNAWGAGAKTLGTWTFTSGTTMPSGATQSGGSSFATSRYCFDSENDNIIITPTIPGTASKLYVQVKGIMNGASSTAGETGVSGLKSDNSAIAGASGKFTQSKANVSNVSQVDAAVTNETEISFSATNVAKIKINCDTYSKKYIVYSVTITYDESGGGTTYTMTYNANSGSGTMSDAGSPYSSGATVTIKPNEFTRSGYIFTKWNTAADGKGTDYAEGTTFTIGANTTLYAQWVASSVCDYLSRATTGVPDQTGGTVTYTDWSDKSASNTGHSNAVYAGQSAGENDAIQIRSKNSNSGIITTTSGGKVKYVSVVWEGHTTAGRTIYIYGKNEAYSAVTDLFATATQGTKLDSIECGKSTVAAISGDYKYIGICSKDGALYLSSVSIEWTTASLSSIAITTQPTRKYLVGETFSKTGAVVTATYSDASTKDVSASTTWTPTTALTVGTSQTVTASYTENAVEKTATTTIDVYSVTVNKQDASGGSISAGGVMASASGRTLTASVGSTNYKFKNWQFETGKDAGTSISSTTSASTTLTGTPTGNVTIKAIYHDPITVTWKVSRRTYTPYTTTGEGTDGTAEVKYDTKVTTLPTAPSPGSYCGDKFVGWTTDEVYVHGTSPLFTDAASSPALTEDTIFYAVFADYAE